MVQKIITVEGAKYRVSSNDEVKTLLEKLGRQSLMDSDGIRVVGFDSLEPDGEYTLGPQQQQPSQLSEMVDDVKEMKKMLNDMATVFRHMSEATVDFTSSMLQDIKVKYKVLKINKENGEGQMKVYPWREEECEADGQTGCKQILEDELLPLEVDDDVVALYDVRNFTLPEVKAGKRKSKGFSDLAVGPEESMSYAVSGAKDLFLHFTVALVELKTGKADLKQGQLLLQLVALASIANIGQGAVVLGTDCANKWRLLHFNGYNCISVQAYAYGRKCIADLKMLLAEGAARKEQNIPSAKMSTILEGNIEDGDVKLGEFGLAETDGDKAIERETKLRKLAGELESLYGETLEVPVWATASETCPSYYM